MNSAIKRIMFAASLTLSFAAQAADLGLTEGLYYPRDVDCEDAQAVALLNYDGKGLSGNKMRCETTPIARGSSKYRQSCREHIFDGQYSKRAQVTEIEFKKLSNTSFVYEKTEFRLCFPEK